jgi:hypothetical protein
MSDTIRVFVNTRALDLPPGSDVRQALRAFDADLDAALASGAAYVTDGRGIEIEPTTRLESGAILRVVKRAQRGVDADA